MSLRIYKKLQLREMGIWGFVRILKTYIIWPSMTDNGFSEILFGAQKHQKEDMQP